MDNYLVYLAHGGGHFYNETIFSLLTFYKYHENERINIIIYTDSKVSFEGKVGNDVTFEIINDQEIRNWKGSANYVHRLKIKVLQDICMKMGSGNFLLVDGDTVFKKNCAEIFEKISDGQLFLDKCEGQLSKNKGGIAKKIRSFLKRKNTFQIESVDETAVIDQNFIVWNTGTIGFNSEYVSILYKIEELIDLLYPASKILTCEQIAVSYFFQKVMLPEPTENYIHHYWYFKEFRKVLCDFFNTYADKTVNQLIQETARINPEDLSSEKRQYKQKSFSQKQIHKILKGRKWKIPDYKL